MWLLLACSDPDGTEAGGGIAADYVPGEGMAFRYALEGAKQALYDTGGAAETAAPDPTLALALSVTATTWELDEATKASLAWTSGGDGLVVGASQLLPGRLAVGTRGDGVEVVDSGEDTVWYGTFERTVRTSITAGEFAGEATFAEGVGPIRLAVGGARWELVYYERP